MAIITVRTNISGFLFQPVEVFLENRRITLSGDGNGNFQSTDVVEVKDGKLSILFHARGIPTTAWKFLLTQLNPQKKELSKNEGEISENGHSVFTDFVEIP